MPWNEAVRRSSGVVLSLNAFSTNREGFGEECARRKSYTNFGDLKKRPYFCLPLWNKRNYTSVTAQVPYWRHLCFGKVHVKEVTAGRACQARTRRVESENTTTLADE